MGIIFCCCLNLRDPSNANSSASVPGNDCCFGTVLQKCKQVMHRHDFETLEESDSTSPDLATQGLAPEVSNDENLHQVHPQNVQSVPESSQSHVEVPITENTRAGEGVLHRQTEQMPASDSASTSRVQSSEPHSAVSVPDRTREGTSSSEGASNSQVTEPNVLVLNSEETDVSEQMLSRQTDRTSSSEEEFNPRAQSSETHVEIPDKTRAGEQEKPRLIEEEQKKVSSISSEKDSLPTFYRELYAELVSADEEDVCPTCLEDYYPENPKIVTECFHHFHLSCIYAWMERSNTCPMCFRVMVFNEAV